MTFVLRLFFTGLMAFVPSQDGKELTVLLLNVDHNYVSSDGSSLAHHKPLLIARAGGCSGDCPTDDSEIAQFIYADKSLQVAVDSLESAVGSGAAWLISGSDLSIRKGSPTDPDLPALTVADNGGSVIPTTAAERESFHWVADLRQLSPTGSALNDDVFTSPPPGLIAARLHLRSGKAFTYSVARIGSNVTPVHYERLDGQGSAAAYSKAVATWVGAEIEISGDSVQIVDEKFNGDTGRTMTLTPNENGQVEIAVLNLPPFVPPSTPFAGTPDPGKHFEMFYELLETPPSQASRLVPKSGAAPGMASYPEVDWHSIHPEALWSDLLNAIRLNIGRTVYEQLICPPGTW